MGPARQLVGELMTARMKAVSQSRRVRMFFPDDHQYKVCDDANGDHTVDDCEGAAKVRDLQTNDPQVRVSATANPFFEPRGYLGNGATVTITVTNSSGSKSIEVNLTGRVKLRSSTRADTVASAAVGLVTAPGHIADTRRFLWENVRWRRAAVQVIMTVTLIPLVDLPPVLKSPIGYTLTERAEGWPVCEAQQP